MYSRFNGYVGYTTGLCSEEYYYRFYNLLNELSKNWPSEIKIHSYTSYHFCKLETPKLRVCFAHKNNDTHLCLSDGITADRISPRNKLQTKFLISHLRYMETDEYYKNRNGYRVFSYPINTINLFR